MALKGGRNIVVRDLKFKWKACHPSMRVIGVSPQFMDIIVHAVEGQGKLRAKVASDLWGQGLPDNCDPAYQYESGYDKHKATVAPGDVRLIIEKAIDDGWDPEEGPQWELAAPLKLKHYSVRGVE